MKIVLSLFISLMVFVVTACGPIYQTKYSYQPPHSDMGRMCASQCLQSKSSCDQMCQMRKDNCFLHARQNALVQFEAYKAEQKAKSKPVEKTPASFENTAGCDQPCNCGFDFNMCYQTCGGVVTKYEVCTAFCDKKKG
ncbi:MAG: hypothetical protein ABI597_00355 [Gammaproteobacteria bacterium]